MRPRILLTGRCGQVGSALQVLLPTLGELIAIDRAELNLLEIEHVRRFIRDSRPQIIINAAAYTAVDAAETDQADALVLNAEVPGVLAEGAEKIDALLVHYSTDYVFDGSKTSPYTEADSPNPLNVYGKTKLAGEEAIRRSGARHLIFRTSWLYSTGGRNFLLAILRLATEREELKVVCDQIGAPTCANDVARATSKIVEEILRQGKDCVSGPHISGTYHMTAGGETNWYEFAKAIVELAPRVPLDTPWFAAATQGRPLITKSILPISSAQFRSPVRRPSYSVLSNSRLLRIFNIALPDWTVQLQCCLSAGNPDAALGENASAPRERSSSCGS
jgi:dTDP-4-dehydrorhamnose reductase